MTCKIIHTGISDKKFRTLLRKQISVATPNVFGVAVAYVSVSGFNYLNKILRSSNVEEIRLVTDIRDGVTHPSALRIARDEGWAVRVVDSAVGTFHPKLYLGGGAFADDHTISDTSMVIVSSANLTLGGLQNNHECTFYGSADKVNLTANQAWKECWETGAPVTPDIISSYEKRFAERNRYRKPEDIIALGISDEIPDSTNGLPNKSLKPPPSTLKVFTESVAHVAWAGLESFTGDYTLQVEFPKESGLVLNRLISQGNSNNSIELLCADSERRNFKYKYYDNNGMFRLNVPNSVPFVPWVRENKQGIACVEVDESADAIKFEICKPGKRMQEIIHRSLTLGSWGRTPTRLYGWY